MMTRQFPKFVLNKDCGAMVRLLWVALAGWLCATAACRDSEAPKSDPKATKSDPADLLNLAQSIPGLKIHLPYATENNFLKRVVYPAHHAYLRRDAAERLGRVQEDLKAQGFGLLIWDAYRPLRVQKLMWEITPDARYVANPAKGSRHNRGAAVDVTLVDAGGTELEMPTAFDDFSPQAGANAITRPAAARHRKILQEAMKKQGFNPLASEWWHFDAPGWEQYDVLDVPIPEEPAAILPVERKANGGQTHDVEKGPSQDVKTEAESRPQQQKPEGAGLDHVEVVPGRVEESGIPNRE
jgi:D-alanyl-D-alanine dipeptidase